MVRIIGSGFRLCIPLASMSFNIYPPPSNVGLGRVAAHHALDVEVVSNTAAGFDLNQIQRLPIANIWNYSNP
jgi:hypothetical protein